MRQLEIGDLVYIPMGWRTHSATIKVEAINRRSIKGVEVSGSYRPHTQWTCWVRDDSRRLARRTYNETAPFVTEEWFTLGENGEMI